MGTANSTQKPKTGRKQVLQKLDAANKTGVLSLREHNLERIPEQVFELVNLTTLDLSSNKLKDLASKLSKLTKLKSLNVENNRLQSLEQIFSLYKLQNLSAGKNKLGVTSIDAANANIKDSYKQKDPLPDLPNSLKQIKLDNNHFQAIPTQILSSSLIKVVKLDLSFNNIAHVPASIGNLTSLAELNLSHNVIPSLCPEISQLSKLKSLSLEYNAIHVTNAVSKWTDQNPQPLPKGLFEETELIDLNLKGNKLNNTHLNSFEGFDSFLERREKMKSKGIYGGALTEMSVCGLE